MTMSISPENQKLLSEAVATGQFKTEDEALTEALRLLRDTTPLENGPVLLPAQLKQKLEAHLATTPTTGSTFVDDSREAIYEGRGE